MSKSLPGFDLGRNRTPLRQLGQLAERGGRVGGQPLKPRASKVCSCFAKLLPPRIYDESFCEAHGCYPVFFGRSSSGARFASWPMRCWRIFSSLNGSTDCSSEPHNDNTNARCCFPRSSN